MIIFIDFPFYYYDDKYDYDEEDPRAWTKEEARDWLFKHNFPTDAESFIERSNSFSCYIGNYMVYPWKNRYNKYFEYKGKTIEIEYGLNK